MLGLPLLAQVTQRIARSFRSLNWNAGGIVRVWNRRAGICAYSLLSSNATLFAYRVTARDCQRF